MTTILPFALVRRFLAIGDFTVRRGYIARILGELDETTLALFLDYMIDRIESVEVKAIWLDTALALLDAATLPVDLRRTLYARLAEGARRPLYGFLSEALWTPPDALADTPYDFEDVPLGVRKARARQRNKDWLMTLAADPHPDVIRILLDNALVTEAHAMRIAARRPQTPDTFLVVLASIRFGTRPSIQGAVALNPFCPPRVALACLPLLSKARLREVAGSAFMDARVREAAGLLW